MMKIFVQSRVLIMQDKSQTFTDYRIGYTCAMNNCLDFAQQNTAFIHNVSSLLISNENPKLKVASFVDLTAKPIGIPEKDCGI